MKERKPGRVQVECVICGNVMASVYDYHKHNVRQHSVVQLSRAILRLRNLQVPINDPTLEEESDDEEEENEEEEKERFDINMALGLPVKIELMDEEVIELGPTDNADNLQIQSRLVKNEHEFNEHSRQVIEVKENNPPPCYINPAVEDLDAIVVRFNKEMVMAQDNTSPLVYTNDHSRKSKSINRQLRAAFKRTIDIPNPSAFIMDYRKVKSRATDKYVMQNVNPVNEAPKKRRGRPRKNAESSFHIPTRLASKRKIEECEDSDGDEDDLEAMVDPPLFSDDEDEETSAAVPNITRTRSGRAIKIKKEDGTFKYYDMPGRHRLDIDDLSNSKDWAEEVTPSTKGRRGRKHKQLIDSVLETPKSTVGDTCSNSKVRNINNTAELIDIKPENIEQCNISNMIEQGLCMPSSKLEESSIEFDRSSVAESLDELECFLCFKTFAFKEDCEKHVHEHLGKVVVDSNEATSRGSHAFDEKVSGDNDMVPVEIQDVNLVLKEGDTSAEEGNASQECQVQSSSNLLRHSHAKESFTCSICNEDFESQTALQDHKHDTIHECKFCGKKYQNRINLQTHMKRYHEETEWMKFKCATCGMNFGFLTALERHMKDHNPNQKFCCEQCGKVFKSLTNLKNHIPLHTRDEIYECPYCPKRYYIRYSYEKHIKTHISAPKFHCKICDKSFSDRKYFDNHLERHQHGGSLGRSKDYRCNNCGDIKTPTELELISENDPGHHKTCLECGKGLYKRFMIENIDASSLPTKCDRQREQCKICGKSVLNLPRHIKYTHLGNEYVPCDVCGIMVTKASLPSHKNRKHGGSAVACDHCNRIFKNVMCLREHMTKVRRKEDPAKSVCKFCKVVVAPDLWKEHMMRHRTKCNDCGASDFQTHERFVAHLESCRRCSNCGTTDFKSRGEFLAHIEMCGSSIDIMTGTLDASNDQEVVTSIFAIVDDSTCCETCGEVFEDQGSLAHHITEAHPNALSSGPSLEESSMINEAVLYACPQESCGIIVTSKDLLKDHLINIHNIQILNVNSCELSDT